MSMFHVGQKVAYVSSPAFVPVGCTTVYVGCVYTIRHISDTDDGLGVWLEEVRNPLSYVGEEWGFFATRFRPVKNTSIEVFRALLSPIHERENA
jgi:hypothetical protein